MKEGATLWYRQPQRHGYGWDQREIRVIPTGARTPTRVEIVITAADGSRHWVWVSDKNLRTGQPTKEEK